MTRVTADVVIIGAGPAGAYLLNRFEQLGISCVAIEKRSREQLASVERAGLLEHRAVELLKARFGSELLDGGQPHGRVVFRAFGRDVELNVGDYCDGRLRMALPQAVLVDRMLERSLRRGGDVRFECEAQYIEQHSDSVEVRARQADGCELRLSGRYVVAADGHSGLGRRTGETKGLAVDRFRFPQSWLVIAANVAPSAPCTVYAIHPHGFAAHLPRTDKVTRFYLQVHARRGLSGWSSERIWTELERRLGGPEHVLRRGEITATRVLALCTEVVDSMVQGRLLLVGDAAHVVPPCGGKGLNLALMDAEGLAAALSDGRTRACDPARLQAWSQQRLVDIWDRVQFCHGMAKLLHNEEQDPDNARFAAAMKRAWLSQLATGERAGREFARRWVGV